MKKANILLAVAFVFAFVGGAQAKTYLNTGRMNDVNDFEDYPVGVISCPTLRDNAQIRNGIGKISDSFSVDVTSGNLCSAIDETLDANGESTKALHYYVNGVSKSTDMSLLLQPRPDTTATSWDTPTLGHYFVYKMKFKSGGDGCGYFVGNRGNFAAIATVDWSTGKIGWGYGTDTLAFALDEWVTFTYVLDRTGEKDVQTLRFESSIGTKEITSEVASKKTIKNSEPRWLMSNGWISGGSSKSDNPSLFIDDFEIYVTDYLIDCDNNGMVGVEPENKIELRVDGDVDEDSLQNILVTAAGNVVEVSSIDYEDNVCTITLPSKMKEFTEYVIDLSSVNGIDGIKKKLDDIRFTTTGKIVLGGSAKISKLVQNEPMSITKLERGLIETEFTLTNETEEKLENATIVARLVSNNNTKAICYKAISINKKDSQSFRFGFLVDGDNQVIEICAKNSLNGNVYYTDIYKITKDGIENVLAEESDLKVPLVSDLVNEDNKVDFFSLVLGQSASRIEATKVANLTEAAVRITDPGDAMLISVLKSDGVVKQIAYCVRDSVDDIMHTVLNTEDTIMPEINSFVWDNLKGSIGYLDKAVLK